MSAQLPTENTDELPAAAIEILLTCCEIGHWHVSADNLIAVAELARKAFITLEDDYENIVIRRTESGLAYAIERSWLESNPDAIFEPWTRTEAGQRHADITKEKEG